MRLSRNSIQKAIGAVAIGTGIASSASAGIVYELRYTGGPVGSDTGVADPLHQRNAIAGGVYNVELWARVSGTNGTTTDEGLINSLITMTSTQLGGGAATSGAIGNVVNSLGYNETGSRVGVANNITADGMGDWGGTNTNIGTDTTYLLPRNATVAGGIRGGGSVGASVDANTWSYRLSTFDVTVNAISGTNGAVTQYNVVKPAAVTSGVSPAAYAAWTQDNTTGQSIGNTSFGSTYSNSTGIQLLTTAAAVTPEPASLGLIGAAAVGLLGRRRRSN